ncbi:hypothetical protein RHMOL_Rhmol11G0219100 [Rhododendron molle]|uniref:Uncharacterized protein n=2 Tax=Rhododendron molle TaxID=49168 RepID=A0ACC0LV74_RHOML|nr:hypothetical protein RHMOL_Rhmol11G0219100 [Rhododendron molle]KAI8532498.1 hypothetical protein RHMOL_Rhmol11G0219100 [Rhododendron molle]
MAVISSRKGRWLGIRGESDIGIARNGGFDFGGDLEAGENEISALQGMVALILENMILNGCSLVTPGVYPKAFNSKSCFSGPYCDIPPLRSGFSYGSIRSSWRPYQELTLQSSIGKTPLLHLAGALPPLLSGQDGSFSRSTIPTICRQKKQPFLAPPRASMEADKKKKKKKKKKRAPMEMIEMVKMPWHSLYPASKGEKVMWWWRILACIPYLVSLRDTSKYWEAACGLYPFLEQFKFLTSGFYRVFDKLPRWFVMLYFVAAYFGVVRRKELPHFLRFNTVMSMLLDNAFQITEVVISFLPFAFYGSTTGCQHFWIAFGVLNFWIALGAVYVLMVLVCMGSSIIGTYVEIPALSKTALSHLEM